MRYFHGFILYLAAFFLQPFLQNLIPPLGNHLNLLLCLTVVLTFVYDEKLTGIFFGFIFALLHDIVFGYYLGPAVLAVTAAGIAVLILREFTNIENIFNALFMMLFSTWLYATVYWGVYRILGSPYSYVYAMKTLPFTLLFNCIAAAVLYLVLIKKVIKHRRDRYFR